jgi:iron-sulfur cluster repair protein YtfE (RIC family)
MHNMIAMCLACTYNFALLMNDKFCNAANNINTLDHIFSDYHENHRKPHLNLKPLSAIRMPCHIMTVFGT